MELNIWIKFQLQVLWNFTKVITYLNALFHAVAAFMKEHKNMLNYYSIRLLQSFYIVSVKVESLCIIAKSKPKNRCYFGIPLHNKRKFTMTIVHSGY